MLKKLYPKIWKSLEPGCTKGFLPRCVGGVKTYRGTKTFQQLTFEEIAWKGLMSGGTVNVPAFARGLQAWVGQKPDGPLPKPGDIFFLRQMGDKKQGPMAYAHIQIDTRKKGCCYEESCKSNIGKCEDNVAHVGIIGKVVTDGERMWETYDGGQGSNPPNGPKTERAILVKRRQNFQTIRTKGTQGDEQRLICLPSNAFEPPPSGEDPNCRIIGGWLDLDLLERYRNREGGKYRDEEPPVKLEPLDVEKEFNQMSDQLPHGVLQPSLPTPKRRT